MVKEYFLLPLIDMAEWSVYHVKELSIFIGEISSQNLERIKRTCEHSQIIIQIYERDEHIERKRHIAQYNGDGWKSFVVIRLE